MADGFESVNSRKRASGVDRANGRPRSFRGARHEGAGIGRFLLVAVATAWGLSSCAGSQESGIDRAPNELPATAAHSPNDPTSDVSLGSPVARDFISSAQAHIAAREYWASESENGLQAPNRAQNLRSYFEDDGVVVHDRTAEGSPKLVELRLAGIGRGNAIEAVEKGEVVATENRVEIRREGIIEWFVNTKAGLEQGFTLSDRPASAREGGELALELAVDGAMASLRGEEVVLATQAGRRLAYGKLAVVDARGETLAARFEVPSPERIRLLVADEGASYPIVIDPLLTGFNDWSVESNQAASELGASVAIAGDVNGDGFDDVVLGAPLFDGAVVDGGAAFVFHGSANGLDPAAIDLTFANTQLEPNRPNAAFGASVAAAGDVNGDGFDDVIVGAPSHSAGQSGEGLAYVFLGSATGIPDGGSTTANTVLQGDLAGAGFGTSVASAGDVNGDGFDDLIVGAPTYYQGLGTHRGKAFAFLGSSTGVANGNPATAHAEFASGSGALDIAFGLSVSSAGDIDGDGFSDVLIGAPGFSGGQALEGAAFLFRGSASGLAGGSPATADAQLESDQSGAEMGRAVAPAGDVNGDGYADIVVGAPKFDSGETDEGAAFVFHGSSSGIADATPATADARLESNQIGAQLGYAVSGRGDINGDGYADVVLGAPGFDRGFGNEGAALVAIGSKNGVGNGNEASGYALASVIGAGSSAGFSVGSGGDLNGDGFGDLIVGAKTFNASEGASFVYHGAARVIRTEIVLELDSNVEISGQAGVQFGFAVASAGDVNGDLYDDVVIGARSYDVGETDEGAAFVFLGAETLPATLDAVAAHAVLQGDSDFAGFGSDVSTAGDVNNDGFDDVIVGAPFYADDRGGAYLFLGSNTGIASGGRLTANTRFEGNQAGARLGWRARTAGDVNGDGYGDLVLLAPLFDSTGAVDNGRAFVFHGRPNGIPNGPLTLASRLIDLDDDGLPVFADVDVAGDVNDDGFGDLIVAQSGLLSVLHGSSAGLLAPYGVSAAGSSVESVSPAGDVNNDGFGDVACTRAGGTTVILHGSTQGLDLIASQIVDGFFGAAGDVDGDGYGDLTGVVVEVVSPSEARSRVAVALGSASGVGSGTVGAVADWQSAWTRNPITSGFQVQFVRSASAGDVNGDGLGDLIVGLPSGMAETPGDKAFLLLGAQTTERPVLPTQRRADASARRVARGGRSDDPSSFEIAMHADHPEGLGRVRLETETCPMGTAFGTPGCTTSLSPSWVTLSQGNLSPVLTADVSGLTAGTAYRWRSRVLRAPANGPIPANPDRGPWRRLAARTSAADIVVVPEPGLARALLFGVGFVLLVGRGRGGRAGDPLIDRG